MAPPIPCLVVVPDRRPEAKFAKKTKFACED